MAILDPVHLDEEIQKQWQVLSNLYAQKNTLVPVSRLPTETLATIFILCARDHYLSHRSTPSSSGVPGWVGISYVCRHWRNVAISCPTLWSYVFTKSRRWMEELMTRSQQAPLRMSLDLRPAAFQARIFEPVEDHVERIEELYLELSYSRNDCQFLSKLRSSPAPRLRNLEIWNLVAKDSSWLPIKAPALRNLTLSSCSAPWYSFTLSNLTTLRIRQVNTSFQLHMPEFLATLGRMPSIVHLYLADALATASNFLSSGAIDTTPRINLPCLSSVVITAPLSAIVAFLSCANIPMRARLTLSQSKCGQSTLDEYNRLYPLLAQRFNSDNLQFRVGPQMIRSLIIDNSSLSMELVFSTSEEKFVTLKRHDSIYPLQVTLATQGLSPLVTERIINDVCHSIPLTNIRNLVFSCPPPSSGFWRRVLGLMPNLRYIKLFRGHMPDITSLLSGISDSRQGQNQTLVPLLKELRLHDLTLSYWTEPQFDLNLLIDALKTRTMSQCSLSVMECRQAIDRYQFKQVHCDSSWKDGELLVDTREYVPEYDSDDYECCSCCFEH